jgi:hypothetical protein
LTNIPYLLNQSAARADVRVFKGKIELNAITFHPIRKKRWIEFPFEPISDEASPHCEPWKTLLLVLYAQRLVYGARQGSEHERRGFSGYLLSVIVIPTTVSL